MGAISIPWVGNLEVGLLIKNIIHGGENITTRMYIFTLDAI
jgi:hypothetical protein